MPAGLRSRLRALLWTVLASSALILTVRLAHGPFSIAGLSVRNPMNAATAFALSALLLLLTSPLRPPPVRSADAPFSKATLLVVTFLLILLWMPISLPLISDDYVHLATVQVATPVELLASPLENRWYRPVTMLSYWVDARWAGFSPLRWHLSHLLLHALNSALVALLAGQLGLGPSAATLAAWLFFVHGSRPEAVVWIAARFDLLATLGVLSALLLALRYGEHGGRRTLVAALACCGFALLSKESAFAFVPLLALLLGAQALRAGKWRLLLPFALLSALVWLLRLRVLHGIGGYRDPQTDAPTVLAPDLLRLVKSLGLRLWATLFVPVNWEGEALVVAALLFVAFAAALVVLLRSGHAHPLLRTAAVFTLLAALPTQHLLLIGPDLEKSRFLYLPSVGFALLLASAWLQLPGAVSRRLVLAALLGWQGVALVNNLSVWRSVTTIGSLSCAAVAQQLQSDPRPLWVAEPPNVIRGVYYHYRGLPECVLWSHGVPTDRLHVVPDSALPALGESAGRVFRWNPATGRLQP